MKHLAVLHEVWNWKHFVFTTIKKVGGGDLYVQRSKKVKRLYVPWWICFCLIQMGVLAFPVLSCPDSSAQGCMYETFLYDTQAFIWNVCGQTRKEGTSFAVAGKQTHPQRTGRENQTYKRKNKLHNKTNHIKSVREILFTYTYTHIPFSHKYLSIPLVVCMAGRGCCLHGILSRDASQNDS